MKKEVKSQLAKDIDKHLALILKEARRRVKNKEFDTLCSSKCASCLAAEARTKVDQKFSIGLTAGDATMLEARGILAEELDWEVN